jgi:hypothetical protein
MTALLSLLKLLAIGVNVSPVGSVPAWLTVTGRGPEVVMVKLPASPTAKVVVFALLNANVPGWLGELAYALETPSEAMSNDATTGSANAEPTTIRWMSSRRLSSTPRSGSSSGGLVVTGSTL